MVVFSALLLVDKKPSSQPANENITTRPAKDNSYVAHRPDHGESAVASFASVAALVFIVVVVIDGVVVDGVNFHDVEDDDDDDYEEKVVVVVVLHHDARDPRNGDIRNDDGEPVRFRISAP